MLLYRVFELVEQSFYSVGRIFVVVELLVCLDHFPYPVQHRQQGHTVEVSVTDTQVLLVGTLQLSEDVSFYVLSSSLLLSSVSSILLEAIAARVLL